MRLKPLLFFSALSLLGLFIAIKVFSNPAAASVQPNTILNTTIDMNAGSFDDFLLSQNIHLNEITKLVVVGDKYSNSQGTNIVIENKEKIAAIWKTYFKNAGSYNQYYGEGSRRLDIYTQRIPNRPALISLIDPTDFTSPVSREDKGFRYPGLEKWIQSELSNQKS
jgi:hypothetical protein